ncbi:MAG: hypothetical protein KatS3mg002_0096 [Candidatus Woesearchaeota archaeon]|nr:MAG: hypothetical protein KatS3mg002_0096 [Candidatus Woesearchaeota archaeon]
MKDNINVEKHIFKLVTPNNWRGMMDNTVSLEDYIFNVNARLIDFEQFIPNNMQIVYDDRSNYDYGQTYFVVFGSKEESQRAMEIFSTRFESYLKKFSDSADVCKLNYILLR